MRIKLTTQQYFHKMTVMGYKPNNVVVSNAEHLIDTLNFLIDKYLHVFPIVITSGWRSRSYNNALRTQGIQTATRSNHIFGNAVDLGGNDIAQYLNTHQDILTEFDLYIEHPKSTPTWSHIQRVPPASKKRVFIP